MFDYSQQNKYITSKTFLTKYSLQNNLNEEKRCPIQVKNKCYSFRLKFIQSKHLIDKKARCVR